MRPGEVQNDHQAFRQIRERIQSEVGTLIELAEQAKMRGAFGDSAPFWALLRAMMPIAESIGDLIHANRSTSKNLIDVLENEFDAVRGGYRGKSAIVAVLYRHGLTHQDELRCLHTGDRELVWQLSFNIPRDHLKVLSDGSGHWLFHFDLHAFHRDLIAICDNCLRREWGGSVRDRYNGWLDLNLDIEKGPAVAQARNEIQQLSG